MTRDGRIRTASQGIIARDHIDDCAAGYTMFTNRSFTREWVEGIVKEQWVGGLAIIHVRTVKGSIKCNFYD